MAGYTPPGINPAKGADLGRLFTGTGPDAAGWQALPIIPHGGGFADPDGVLSAVVDALAGLGVDVSSVPAWSKGFSAVAGAGATADGPGAGWWARYTQDPAGVPYGGQGLYVASPGLHHGDVLGPTEPAAWNPRGDSTDPSTRTLFYFTGLPVYPANAVYAVVLDDGSQWGAVGSTGGWGAGATAGKGQVLTMGSWSTNYTTQKYRRTLVSLQSTTDEQAVAANPGLLYDTDYLP